MILLSTVWHSGTHTLYKGLKSGPDSAIDWTHCGPKALEKAQSGAFDMIATTYRDPYRVAASWANRDEIDIDLWRMQWRIWYEIVCMPETRLFQMPGPKSQHGYPVLEALHVHDDTYQLHAALETHDWRRYYSIVPHEMIDFALPLTVEAQRAKP